MDGRLRGTPLIDPDGPRVYGHKLPGVLRSLAWFTLGIGLLGGTLVLKEWSTIELIDLSSLGMTSRMNMVGIILGASAYLNGFVAWVFFMAMASVVDDARATRVTLAKWVRLQLEEDVEA